MIGGRRARSSGARPEGDTVVLHEDQVESWRDDFGSAGRMTFPAEEASVNEITLHPRLLGAVGQLVDAPDWEAPEAVGLIVYLSLPCARHRHDALPPLGRLARSR